VHRIANAAGALAVRLRGRPRLRGNEQVSVPAQHLLGLAAPHFVQRPQKGARKDRQAAPQGRCSLARNRPAAIREDRRVVSIEHPQASLASAGLRERGRRAALPCLARVNSRVRLGNSRRND
jgi:hypothetical protein